ncbi:hypothetical protein RRG08_018275 [Elysia crispata]|uniref:Uncharacterized protein n=1 Tax=Elysia crispata TaxID=231223 RepID=A0AAE0ZYD9_9GAST|nr:hypothetical protein RRG08_018275 [Elysia crispata]
MKRVRHSNGGKSPQITCHHDASKCCCWAEYLTHADLALNQSRFYSSANKYSNYQSEGKSNGVLDSFRFKCPNYEGTTLT